MWTRNRLKRYVQTKLGGARLVIVANRETYVHEHVDGHVQVIQPPGGLVTAIDPILQATGGVLVAQGSGSADREASDSKGRVRVPPEDPAYTIRRLWFSEEEINGYYFGFSNEALWPLCHMAYTRPIFLAEHWEIYQAVNQRFADAVLEEVGADPAFVWIQDYHLALVPRLLKQRRPDLLVAHFWHIPWPSWDIFQVCPWHRELLWGLLGNDLLSFHIQNHCDNFLQCCDRTLEVRVDREQRVVLHHGGVETVVRALPISVDADMITQSIASEATQQIVVQWKRELQINPDAKIFLGVDRLDYTKGIPERLRAFAIMLDKYPEWRERVSFIQLGASSRSHIESYRQLSEEVDVLAEEINTTYGTATWRPIHRVRRQTSPRETIALYAFADVCIVTSLHDGMNLVAKEFLAAKVDNTGMLVLSQFTGAAKELPEAILVNPYSEDECADAFHRALTMPEDDRQLRMEAMRETVLENNIFRWAGRSIAEMARIA